MNKIKILVLAAEEDLGEVIDSSISMSAVTSIEAFDKPVLALNTPAFLRKLVQRLVPKLKEKLDGVTNVKSSQKRFSKHARIDFDKLNDGYFQMWTKFTPVSVTDGIKLSFYQERGILPIKTNPGNFEQDVKLEGLESWIMEIQDSMLAFCKENPEFKIYKSNEKNPIYSAVWTYKKTWVLYLMFELVLKSANDLNDEGVIDKIAEASKLIYELQLKLNEQHLKGF